MGDEDFQLAQELELRQEIADLETALIAAKYEDARGSTAATKVTVRTVKEMIKAKREELTRLAEVPTKG